jgi:TIR domain
MDPQRNMLFVSHAAPEDNEFARWLALQLGKEGFPVWCDQTKLLGGEPFWEEIEGAIRNRTRRFLFVQSRNSNQKDGPLDELALAKTIQKQVGDSHFITAIRIDDLPFAEFNIRLHKLNSVDCAPNWLAGFKQLVKRLQEDGIERDKRFTPDTVAVWWRENFGEDEGVSEATDFYCSNRLRLLSLPPQINIIRLEHALPEDADVTTAPFPVSPHGRLLVSFATFRDLLPFFEGAGVGNDGTETMATTHLLENGLVPAVESRAARNHVSFLLRQAFQRFAVSRGLREYELSGNRRFFWFPKDLVENDRISFRAFDGRKTPKAIVGFKSLKTKEGQIRIRNWHFGIEGLPHVGFDSYLSVLPHVAFSEDGQVYESARKQHAYRRSQCRSWYNNDWRDRLLATLAFLSGATVELHIPLAPDSSATFQALPEQIESPVTYTRTADEREVEEAEPDGEFESDDVDEEEDEL